MPGEAKTLPPMPRHVRRKPHRSRAQRVGDAARALFGSLLFPLLVLVISMLWIIGGTVL